MTSNPVVKVVQSEAVQKAIIHMKVIGRNIAMIVFFSLQADAVGGGDWGVTTILRNLLWATAVYHMVILTGYTVSLYLLYTNRQPLSLSGDTTRPVDEDQSTITLNRAAFRSINRG